MVRSRGRHSYVCSILSLWDDFTMTAPPSWDSSHDVLFWFSSSLLLLSSFLWGTMFLSAVPQDSALGCSFWLLCPAGWSFLLSSSISFSQHCKHRAPDHGSPAGVFCPLLEVPHFSSAGLFYKHLILFRSGRAFHVSQMSIEDLNIRCAGRQVFILDVSLLSCGTSDKLGNYQDPIRGREPLILGKFFI